MQPPPPAQHHPFLKLDELPAFLQRINECNAKGRTRLGILLLLLTGVRTGEMRFATPDQFDLDKGIWIIPARQVKHLQRHARRRPIPPYIVPLSTLAIKVVQELLNMRTGRQQYLIAHQNNPQKPMYEGILTGHQRNNLH